MARAGNPVLTTAFRGVFRDGRRIAALVPTQQRGWVVGVTWSTRDAFEEMDSLRRQQLAVFVVIAVLVMSGAWALATYLSGRVSRLVEQAHWLGRGDLRQWPPLLPSRLRTSSPH